jgi:hypothetical protein
LPFCLHFLSSRLPHSFVSGAAKQPLGHHPIPRQQPDYQYRPPRSPPSFHIPPVVSINNPVYANPYTVHLLCSLCRYCHDRSVIAFYRCFFRPMYHTSSDAFFYT